MTLAAGEKPLCLARRSLNTFLSSGSGHLSFSPDRADSAILLCFEVLKVLRMAAEKVVFSPFWLWSAMPPASAVSGPVHSICTGSVSVVLHWGSMGGAGQLEGKASV